MMIAVPTCPFRGDQKPKKKEYLFSSSQFWTWNDAESDCNDEPIPCMPFQRGANKTNKAKQMSRGRGETPLPFHGPGGEKRRRPRISRSQDLPISNFQDFRISKILKSGSLRQVSRQKIYSQTVIRILEDNAGDRHSNTCRQVSSRECLSGQSQDHMGTKLGEDPGDNGRLARQKCTPGQSQEYQRGELGTKLGSALGRMVGSRRKIHLVILSPQGKNPDLLRTFGKQTTKHMYVHIYIQQIVNTLRIYERQTFCHPGISGLKSRPTEQTYQYVN